MDEPLTGLLHTGTAVVGGGWTGLLTAAFLAESGMEVLLLTDRIPGHDLPVVCACANYDPRLRRILASHGPERTRMHAAALKRVMGRLPDWLGPLAPWREAEAFTYARNDAERTALFEHMEFMTALGLKESSAPDAGGCPFPVEASGVCPCLLIDAKALAAALVQRIRSCGGQVYLHSQVLNASAKQVFTADGRVDAELVLLCTGKPLGLRSYRQLSLLESRTGISARLRSAFPLHTVQTPVIPGGVALLPVSGGAEALWDAGRTGTREERERTALFRNLLQKRLPEWPAETLRFHQTVRTLDGLPMVGSLRAPDGQILCAAGAEDFLTAVLAAQALARLALRRPRPEDLVMRPDRPIPRWLLRHGRLRLRRHRAVNALRRSAPRCSHCACRLRYHDDARWWGCPCCGSVFGLLGRRLSGPALTDAEISAAQRPGW